MKKNRPPQNCDDVKEKALRLLEFRAHSEKELRDKLKRYGANDDDISYALEFCTRYGFINDADYARRKAADLANLKKYGRYRIKTELKLKGIADDMIEDALNEIDPDTERDTLEEIAKKRLKGDFSKKNVARCFNYLAYRGYGSYDIRGVIASLAEECQDEGSS